MDVRFITLIVVFLVVSYKCYVQFRDNVGVKLVNKLQEHFEDVECPSGISLYRLQRDGVLFRVQIQTRLPHNPSAKKRIVRRCETLKPLLNTHSQLPGASNAKQREFGQHNNGVPSVNASSNVYLDLDPLTSRLLRESCDLIDYETHECDLVGDGSEGCGTGTTPPAGAMGYLLEVVKRPNTFSADEHRLRASETWSIQTLTTGIFPGTLWCGFGNIADDTYGKLGEHSETDDCCRSHDLCKPIIKAFQTRYSYSNPSIVPISHCACDMSFYNCLMRVNSPTSKMIGKIFFNLVKMKCFDFDLRHVCISSILGLCLKRGEQCIAVIKQNKRFPV